MAFFTPPTPPPLEQGYRQLPRRSLRLCAEFQDLALDRPSCLVKIPNELIFGIASYLSPSDMLALSLSCKPLSHMLYEKAIEDCSLLHGEQHLGDFLRGLERDLASSHYYCDLCVQLHDITFLDGPGTASPIRGFGLFNDKAHESARQLDKKRSPPCAKRRPFYNSSAPYIAYHHGRLVMNRHFYGESAGWPIEKLHFNVKSMANWASGITADDPSWSTKCRGKIVQGQLVLSTSHTLASKTIRSLLAAINSESHGICPHQSTDETHNRLDTFEGCNLTTLSSLIAVPEISGFCSECVTDYTIRMTKTRIGDTNHYTISIQCYHLLGQFRDPQDWKWCAFSKPARSFRPMLFPGANQPQPARDLTVAPPGIGRDLWLSHA